jgi:hypothetical protein
LSEALNFLQHGEAEAIIASRQTLEQSSSLRIFPNKLAENNIVALFAPESKALQEEFNKSLRIERIERIENKSSKSSNQANQGPDNIDKIINLLGELKKEFEILQKELK